MISVDTEGDDQWDNSHPITTRNTAAVPAFQELCERYGMKPVWLTDYEMAKDPAYVSYIRPKMEAGLCEIGMHLHAWTTPPHYDLKRASDAREYLVEFDEDQMSEKISTMTRLLEDTFGQRPVSHRSGRWVMDQRYFHLLDEYGYLVDCSVTPHVSWENTPGATGMGGCDYRNEAELPHMKSKTLMEIPVTVRRLYFLNMEKVTGAYSFARECRNAVRGIDGWLRPYDLRYWSVMSRVFLKAAENGEDVLMTLHSSELMAGTNEVFRTEEEVRQLFNMFEKIFSLAADHGYRGCTMREYYNDNVSSLREVTLKSAGSQQEMRNRC